MDPNNEKLYAAFLVGIIILALFLIYFILIIIRHQRKSQDLHVARINAEITTQERERRRIAADLHDDLGPMLSSVKLLLSSIEQKSSEDQEVFVKINLYLDNILQQLQRISNDLMPPALTRKGLVNALDEQILEMNPKRKMQVRFQYDPHLHIPVEEGIHLFRIINEVMHNAEKHASASLMEIGIHEKEGRAVIRLKDNGQGFDVRGAGISRKGFGLRNIATRVEAIRGVLHLESSPAKGTEYIIILPAAKKA